MGTDSSSTVTVDPGEGNDVAQLADVEGLAPDDLPIGQLAPLCDRVDLPTAEHVERGAEDEPTLEDEDRQLEEELERLLFEGEIEQLFTEADALVEPPVPDQDRSTRADVVALDPHDVPLPAGFLPGGLGHPHAGRGGGGAGGPGEPGGTWRLDESDNGAWTCMSCHRLSAECGGSCMPAGGRVRGGHGAAGDGGQLARVPPALGSSPAPPGTPHRSCDGTVRRGYIDFDSPFSTQPCLSPPQSFGARTMASSPGPEDLLEALGLKRPAHTVSHPSPEPEAPEPPLKRYRYCCKQAPRQADRVASCCTRRDPQAGT